MNNKYGYRLVDILRGADGSREPEEEWRGARGEREIKASLLRGGVVGKDVASTFLCRFVGILMPEGRINCFMIQFTEILRHFNHKNYNTGKIKRNTTL